MTGATITSDADALNATRTFFSTVFGTALAGTAIVLTTPPTWRVYATPPEDPDAAVCRALRLSRFGADVYVHCGLQDAATVGHRPGRGRAEDIVALSAVWADVDLEKAGAHRRYLPSRGAAERVLRRLPIRPTVVVWSGAGFHWWWCLRAPLVIGRADLRAQAERLVLRWQTYLRQCLGGYALDSTHDLARVLRVPSTINTKYGTPVVLEDASGPRVDAAELEGICAHLPDITPVRAHVDVQVGPLDPAADPPAEKLARLCATSPRFRQLWRRELAPRDRSQSGFDFVLAMLAVEAGWLDDEITTLLVAHARSGGRSPKPAAYYARTIGRARSPRCLRIEVG